MNKTNSDNEVYEESDLITRPSVEVQGAQTPVSPYRCSSLARTAPNYTAQKINYNCYGLCDFWDNGIMKAYNVTVKIGTKC